MDGLSDSEEGPPDPFIVLDSQQVDDEHNINTDASSHKNKHLEKTDSHTSILKELDMSKPTSCPETPSPRQGKSANSRSIATRESADASLAGSVIPDISTCVAVGFNTGKSDGSEEKDASSCVIDGLPPFEEDSTQSMEPELKPFSSVQRQLSDSSSGSREFCKQNLSSPSSSSKASSVEFCIPDFQGSESSTCSSGSAAKTLIEIEAHKLTSSDDSKTSSFSSSYPDTSSSNHRSCSSRETPEIPSSPEFRVPSALPWHKTLSDASSSSSDMDKSNCRASTTASQLETAPQQHGTESQELANKQDDKEFKEDTRKEPAQLLENKPVKLWRKDSLEKESSNLPPFLAEESGVSSAGRKILFEENSASHLISSTEVSHIDMPKQHSTPVDLLQNLSEPSFDCLQLSGEQRHAAEYLMPDPLMSSPSVLASAGMSINAVSNSVDFDSGSSSTDDTKNRFKHERKMLAKQEGIDPHSALPKWVQRQRLEIERKKIEFPSSSDSATKSSSNSPTSPVSQFTDEISSNQFVSTLTHQPAFVEIRASATDTQSTASMSRSQRKEESVANRIPSPDSLSSRLDQEKSSSLKIASLPTDTLSLEARDSAITPTTYEELPMEIMLSQDLFPPSSTEVEKQNQPLRYSQQPMLNSSQAYGKDFGLYLSQTQIDPSPITKDARLRASQQDTPSSINAAAASLFTKVSDDGNKEKEQTCLQTEKPFTPISITRSTIEKSIPGCSKDSFSTQKRSNEDGMPGAGESSMLPTVKKTRVGDSVGLEGNASNKSQMLKHESRLKEATQVDPDETFVYSIIKVTRKVKTVRKETRTFVQEYRSHDRKLLKRISYVEESDPEETIIEEPVNCTEDFVPLSHVDIDVGDLNDQGELKGKVRRTPKKFSPKPTRSSPRASLTKLIPKTPKKSPKSLRSPEKSKQSHAKSFGVKPSADVGLHQEGTRNIVLGEGEKSEYEKLLEISLAYEGVTRRRTRSLARQTDVRDALTVNSRCFAKWVDGHYYPGNIEEKDNNERYKVNFDDGNHLVLSPKSIFQLNFIPDGQEVFVKNADGNFYKGIVIKVERLTGEYEIKRHDENLTRHYRTPDLMLDASQIANISSAVDGDDAGMAQFQETMLLENPPDQEMLGILPSSTDPNVSKPDRKLAKRQKRAMEFNQQGSTTTSPEEPPVRIPPKKRKIEASDSRGVAENLRNLANTSATVTGSLPVEDSKAKKRKAAKEQYKKDVANPSFITEFGPLPTNKEMFRGYGFIITFVKPKETTLEEDLEGTLRGFHRKHLESQIEAGNGVVVDHLKDCSDLPIDRAFLVAQVEQKTNKYYFALASGIPCVSHLWVRKCCEENRMMPHFQYRLPAGKSEATNEFIQVPESTRPLRGKTIYTKALASREDDIKTLLAAAGSGILSKLNISRGSQSNIQTCDYIVVDDGCSLPSSLLLNARRYNIPCVSLCWLSQCIIHGACLPIDMHPRFLYH